MPYSELTPKAKRSIGWDVNTLFSVRAFVANPSWEEVGRLAVERPSIKYGKGTHFLSEVGAAALARLCQNVGLLSEHTGLVSDREIGDCVLVAYNDLLVESLQPTGQEFVEEVAKRLTSKIRNYQFLIQIEGLDLKGQESLDIGALRIQRPNRALLDHVKFEGGLSSETVFEQLKDHLWLVGDCKASADIASQIRELKATLAIGIIAVSGALLYRGAIWRSRVRAVLSPFENRKAVCMFMWESGGHDPSLTRRYAERLDLPVDANSVEYLKNRCFLKQLGSLLDIANRTEVQDSIVRSLYWFADAYKDLNPAMQFVKLWTCAESFFSIDPEGVTELVSSGIASLLTFAGFHVSDMKNYPKLKRRIEDLYDSRSTALHRAEFAHIKTKDLDDLSYWVAWVIISMVSLSERGYKTLREVRKHADRLDGLADSE